MFKDESKRDDMSDTADVSQVLTSDRKLMEDTHQRPPLRGARTLDCRSVWQESKATNPASVAGQPLCKLETSSSGAAPFLLAFQGEVSEAVLTFPMKKALTERCFISQKRWVCFRQSPGSSISSQGGTAHKNALDESWTVWLGQMAMEMNKQFVAVM